MPRDTHGGSLWRRLAQLGIAAVMTVTLVGTGVPTPRTVIGDQRCRYRKTGLVVVVIEEDDDVAVRDRDLEAGLAEVR